MASDSNNSDSPRALHSPLHNLQAAAAQNAGIQNERTSSATDHARRRSSIRMNLSLMDPNMPSPAETQRSPSLSSHRPSWPASPHHQRAPSLGELHQELESEQEAQVNRLLNMIRTQQAQIASLRSANQQPASNSAIDDSTPSSERSLSLPQSAAASQQNVSQIAPPRPRSPLAQAQTPLSRNSSYRRSRNSSRTGSPSLRPVSSAVSDASDWVLAGANAMTSNRDESAFYQAETQMLTRENQMLKMRIRELAERQLHDHNPAAPPTSNLASPPLHPQPAATSSTEADAGTLPDASS
ncbi:hypothetical protein K490DRAFT_37250 [Saccharata proteae CBS 121410]|uniref:Uncharacterized protein n=1 Tax=Saccharata proteae CBS 121410 TaxID=1314787 RepID=A0A6A5YC38_9PEZI|nr:hypothetical protein K490DRAFT_37250 [Saccharata proteae CBS 121410]